MIWIRGHVSDPGTLTIPASDRVFEHGLGLFESLRTYRGEALLLDRHLARLIASADALGIPIDRDALPDAGAVRALRLALGIEGDCRLRITLTGGVSPGSGSILWMTAAPFAAATAPAPLRLVASGWTITTSDPLARHKTLNYWSKRLAFERATALGADEAYLWSEDGRVWEASRSNLWVRSGSCWRTPGPEGPFLPGILRGVLLEAAHGRGVEVLERDVSLDDLRRADEVVLTNSVRGVVPVGLVDGKPIPGGQAGGRAAMELSAAFAAFLGISEDSR